MSEQLSDAQLEAFDSEYVNAQRWEVVRPLIEEAIGDSQRFVVLDVGGGSGAFADRLIDAFPQVEVIVAEPAGSLRDRNRPHARKRCLDLGIDELATSDLTADLICFNWVLHHLVDRGYRSSRRRIRAALHVAARMVRDDGHVSIFENDYNGALIDDLPGWITFWSLRLPILRALAGSRGANTAGVGVCYLSRHGWTRTLAQTPLELVCTSSSDAQAPALLARSRLLRGAIGLRSIEVGHYWLARSR